MKRASLILASSLLLACGAAQAQTPQSQQAPQPAPQQQPAQRAAPAPQPASAQQTAACTKVAGDVIDKLDKGDYATASQSFESKLGVDEGKLKTLWSNISGEFGHVQSVGQSQQGQQVQGYTVVLLPVTFDKGNLAAQVACDSEGSLADLRFGRMPSSSPGTGSSPNPKS